jgi:hypothetical protein
VEARSITKPGSELFRHLGGVPWRPASPNPSGCYLGVAVGEHLGYALTGAWSILTGVALIETDAAPGWIGVIGVVIGPLVLISSAEFLGRFEPSGWSLRGQVTPVAYILWSVWLVAIGWHSSSSRRGASTDGPGRSPSCLKSR